MKTLFTFFLIFAFAFNSYSLPLVFKTTKEVKEASYQNFVNLFTFNTRNLKQIRITLQIRNLESSKIEETKGFRVFAVESGEDVFIGYFEGYSAVIDAPPSEIKIKVSSVGNYKVFIWGS